MSWELVALSAFGGSFLTYVLSAQRESRRMAETYRDPQRRAVGDIAEAKSGLVIAAAVANEAILAELQRANWTRNPGGQIDQGGFVAEMNGVRSAAIAAIRAIDLGRIVVVDPVCREALDRANTGIEHVKVFLAQPHPRNFVQAPHYGLRLMDLMDWFEIDVERLVDMAVRRLGPVVPLRVRLQRAKWQFARWGDAKLAEWDRLAEED